MATTVPATSPLPASERLPEMLRPLFWDSDFDQLTWRDHRDYVLRCVLSVGTWDAVCWLPRQVQRPGLGAVDRATPRARAEFPAIAILGTGLGLAASARRCLAAVRGTKDLGKKRPGMTLHAEILPPEQQEVLLPRMWKKIAWEQVKEDICAWVKGIAAERECG